MNQRNIKKKLLEEPVGSKRKDPSESFEEQDPKPKRRKKQRDSSYHPSQDRAKSGGGSVLPARADSEPENSSVMFNLDVLKDMTPKKRVKLRKQIKKEVKSFGTPLQVLQRSNNGSPLVIKASGKEGKEVELQRTGKVEAASFFSNRPAAPRHEKENLPPEAKQKLMMSSPFRAVKAHSGKIKYQEIVVTQELLDQSARVIKRRKGRRKQSQNKTLAKPGVSEKKASAGQYAKATEHFPDYYVWEWLHFIAHKVLADKSQHEKNMGCGSFNCNTEMMFVEYQLPGLAKQYPEGVSLKVIGHFEEGTQLLTHIDYNICTADFEIPFVFDARQIERPDMTHFTYMKALFESYRKTMDAEALAASPETVRKAELMFFSRAPSAAAQEPKVNVTLNFDDAVDDLDGDTAMPDAKKSLKGS